MATLTESNHAAEFLIEEYSKQHNRDEITVLTGQNLKAGAVIGKQETGTASAVAGGGNTGNGVMGAIAVSDGAQAGAYVLSFVEADANAGDFQVVNPDGDVVGVGSVAVAFSGGGLGFTLADGAADFVVGDTFTITVAAGSGKYVAYDNSASNGSGKAAGILYASVDASAADVVGVAILRGPAVVNQSKLVFDAGQSAGDQTAALADLAALGITAR